MIVIDVTAFDRLAEHVNDAVRYAHPFDRAAQARAIVPISVSFAPLPKAEPPKRESRR